MQQVLTFHSQLDNFTTINLRLQSIKRQLFALTEILIKEMKLYPQITSFF